MNIEQMTTPERLRELSNSLRIAVHNIDAARVLVQHLRPELDDVAAMNGSDELAHIHRLILNTCRTLGVRLDEYEPDSGDAGQAEPASNGEAPAAAEPAIPNADQLPDAMRAAAFLVTQRLEIFLQDREVLRRVTESDYATAANRSQAAKQRNGSERELVAALAELVNAPAKT